MPKREIVYVPIIKSKAGECWVLSHLTPERKPKLRPLIEIHSHSFLDSFRPADDSA
jgi:hypothetical protein